MVISLWCRSLFKILLLYHGYFSLTFSFQKMASLHYVSWFLSVCCFSLSGFVFNCLFVLCSFVVDLTPQLWSWLWWWRSADQSPGGSGNILLLAVSNYTSACFLITHYTPHLHFIHFSDASCISQLLGAGFSLVSKAMNVCPSYTNWPFNFSLLWFQEALCWDLWMPCEGIGTILPSHLRKPPKLA